MDDFIAESAIMLNFNHPNVMKLVGMCFDTADGLPLTIIPYMENGDLKTFLRSKRSQTEGGTSTGSVEVYPQVMFLLVVFFISIYHNYNTILFGYRTGPQTISLTFRGSVMSFSSGCA